ncbi:GNAT family N-acetyltransferase [Halobacillus sp. K22]|uniref:GNAT family N-acetyltransferase n=1 Tax=Halobacillus sp. K22 TaxID=3457431 RepID=UPI003FCECF5A
MTFQKLTDFKAFTEICSRCYPGMRLDSGEAKEKHRKQREKMNKEANVQHFGLYQNKRLVAGYVEYDHTLNLYSRKIDARGIGTLAVDLPYKKQGYAKQIIQAFIKDARDQSIPLVQLYPFQPSFYRKMGFGLGPFLHTFHFHPSQLPVFSQSSALTVLAPADKYEMAECYHRWADRTHGSCEKPLYEFRSLEEEGYHVVGLKREGQIDGYMVFQFKQIPGDHMLLNDLHIVEFISCTTEAYQSLLQFLRNQKDQVRSVYFPTFNEQFSYMLEDPTHTDDELIFRIYHKISEQGQGLMYRIVDVPLFLEKLQQHSFGRESVRIGWNISDSFLDDQHFYVWEFTDGVPKATNQPPDVEIHLGIAEFSSLMMGCVTLDNLLLGGYAEAEPGEHLDQAIALFQQPKQPESWSFF